MRTKAEIEWKLEHAKQFKGKCYGIYLNDTLWDIIDDIIEKEEDKFSSRNHFMRCAVNNLIKKELEMMSDVCIPKKIDTKEIRAGTAIPEADL